MKSRYANRREYDRAADAWIAAGDVRCAQDDLDDGRFTCTLGVGHDGWHEAWGPADCGDQPLRLWADGQKPEQPTPAVTVEISRRTTGVPRLRLSCEASGDRTQLASDHRPAWTMIAYPWRLELDVAVEPDLVGELRRVVGQLDPSTDQRAEQVLARIADSLSGRRWTLADLETIAGLLREAGCEIAPPPDDDGGQRLTRLVRGTAGEVRPGLWLTDRGIAVVNGALVEAMGRRWPDADWRVVYSVGEAAGLVRCSSRCVLPTPEQADWAADQLSRLIQIELEHGRRWVEVGGGE